MPKVFINCPFDVDYAPLLEAAIFCIVYLGFEPRLANASLEAGENRLDKIIALAKSCEYSMHDLSRCKSQVSDEFFRMNMPFEYGIDVGLRKSGQKKFGYKKFLIFETNRYDLKRSLSDIAGQDVEYHEGNFELVIKKIRNFFKVEANCAAAGAAKIISDYTTFLAWLLEKKIAEGHSEKEALELPTKERLDEIQIWIDKGKPSYFQ